MTAFKSCMWPAPALRGFSIIDNTTSMTYDRVCVPLGSPWNASRNVPWAGLVAPLLLDAVEVVPTVWMEAQGVGEGFAS